MFRINIVWLLLLLSSCVVVQEGGSKNEKASKINVQLGIGYYNQGNIEAANEKLVKALQQDPTSSQAHHAYAVLQNRFLDPVKAETHFKKSVELDDKNSEALNNFGTFLCKQKRYEEAEKMFMQAVENPLYRNPFVAFTNAAVCLLEAGEKHKLTAKNYLIRALVLGNNYRPALMQMAELTFEEKDYKLSIRYLERYHLVGQHTARSLWLAIQINMENQQIEKANTLAEQLQKEFPKSAEYQSWLALTK